ncbi:motility protein A [Carnobacteriaceae bacterium 52-44]
MKKLLMPLAGMIIGFVLVFWSITSSGPIGAFIDIPSIVITLFGSMSAVVISFPIKKMIEVPKIMKELLIDPDDNRIEMVQLFTEFSKKARVNGVLSIEDDIQALENETMFKGLQMVVDGKEGEIIKSQMELEMDLTEERYEAAPALFNKWGEFAPAFGMVGTLIGLIVMLGELDDPSLIGTGMATALLTTFYGTMLANLIFLPLATNMKQLATDKMITYEIILEGVIAMQEGQNPRDIEEKLKSYLTTQEVSEMESSEPVSLENLQKQEV